VGGNELQRVAVTGATGLLGRSVVAELLAAGVEVTAIVRSRERAGQALGSHDALHLVEGDILDTTAWAPALRDTDAVIHTAAYFREYYQPRFNPQLLERTNVEAVAALVAAADDADVPVLVHISSSGTIGRASRGERADESTPPGKWVSRNHYYASKVRAEQLIDMLRATHRVRIPVVVPGWMWGPGDGAPTASGQMFVSIANRTVVGIPRVSVHIVDARDVAYACVRAAGIGLSRRYIVAGQRHNLPAVGVQIAHLCDAPAPRPVPARIALATSGLLQLADRLRGRPPLVTPRATRVLTDAATQRISSARARNELGVTFRPIAETLSDEAQWFRQHGLIGPQPSYLAVSQSRNTIEGQQ
jgi:dihydroflavonol-4-reductase